MPAKKKKKAASAAPKPKAEKSLKGRLVGASHGAQMQRIFDGTGPEVWKKTAGDAIPPLGPGWAGAVVEQVEEDAKPKPKPKSKRPA